MSSTMPGLAAVVQAEVGLRNRLIGFRAEAYRCFVARADALFELADAVLTADHPVDSLVELSSEKVFRRGHGALYDGLAAGRIDEGRLGDLLAASWEPADAGPVKVAFDTSVWPRPDAPCSPARCFCYKKCHCGGKGALPGWEYQVAAGLSWGADSWTAPLEAVRLGPADDPTDVVFAQLVRVLGRLAGTGVAAGRPGVLAVFDAGYDLSALAFAAGRDGVDVQVLGRVRANRVFYAPAPPRSGAAGRPAVRGARFVLADPATHPDPDQVSVADSPRYGAVTVTAWHGWHRKLGRDGPWSMVRHPGPLPVIGGTLIRIDVEHLPADRAPEPIWMWWWAPPRTLFDLDLLWTAYLRRFDLEHTFRLFKGVLGWTTPRVRTPAQADRWTQLMLIVYAQLRLARHLVADLRRPWERPATGRVLTPGRVRRGFRRLTRRIGTPAGKPKSSKAGPGRPKGSKSGPAPRHPISRKPSIKDRRESERSRTRPKTG